DTTWIYTYDSHNRMVEAEEYSNSGLASAQYEETYTYNVLGDRVKEVDTNFVTTTITQFVYDRGNVLADLSSTGTVQSRYMWGDQADQILARVDAGGAVAWYLTDHLGSVRNVTDATGAIAGTITYDAFGNITSDSTGTFGGRYKYTGKEFDTATGLQYNVNRYYDPTTGRWTSQDPLGFGAGSSNFYTFVGNSPSTLLDPTGTEDFNDRVGNVCLWWLDHCTVVGAGELVYGEGAAVYQFGNSTLHGNWNGAGQAYLAANPILNGYVAAAQEGVSVVQNAGSGQIGAAGRSGALFGAGALEHSSLVGGPACAFFRPELQNWGANGSAPAIAANCQALS